MPTLEFSKHFLRDVRKWRRSGKGMEHFEEFLRSIEHTWPPHAKYEPHLLIGPLEGIWDIHLRQNWVVLARYHRGTVRFLRMGTHADLGL